MKRTVRVSALITGIAALIVPAVLSRSTPAPLHHAANWMLADGTQPPVPSGPMKPPANRSWSVDGTQPPVPSGPMRPPMA
jgi:hypothetical protein